MVDGVAINDPALGSSVDFANLDLIGATRIEILPGAQSALWGSDALAGVIEFRNDAAPGASMRNVWLEGGSNDTTRESIQLAQRNDAWYYSAECAPYRNGRHQHREQRRRRRRLSQHHAASEHRLHRRTRLGHAGRAPGHAQSEYDPTPFPDFVPVDGNLELNVRQRLVGLTASIESPRRIAHPRRRSNITNRATTTSPTECATARPTATKTNSRTRATMRFDLDATSDLLTWAYEYVDRRIQSDAARRVLSAIRTRISTWTRTA